MQQQNKTQTTNPFVCQSKSIDDYFMDWTKMYPKSYDKNKVDPYTKVRIILMNGTEFESNWFLHQFARNCAIDEIKKAIAVVRRQEQQQQKRIASLKPINETFLETTISYEQLAIDLTAILAQNEKDQNNKNALDFALLEDFDHLYRFANLLKMDQGIDASLLVGKFTEIMPGRPTISEHRYPADDIRKPMNSENANVFTKLVAGIITAAEQQTMNFYMNVAAMYKNDTGRKLFSEIGMIEEQHVSQYESLKDPTCTWLEHWVMHEYTECYLYFSMMHDETDESIKKIWEEHFEMEVAHLKQATKLLKQYESKDYLKVVPIPEFPKLLKFGENIEYVRKVLESVWLTGKGAQYVDVRKLPSNDSFFKFQTFTNGSPANVASHLVIKKFIEKFGKDFRFQVREHPMKELQDRKKDNVTIGNNIMKEIEPEKVSKKISAKKSVYKNSSAKIQKPAQNKNKPKQSTKPKTGTSNKSKAKTKK